MAEIGKRYIHYRNNKEYAVLTKALCSDNRLTNEYGGTTWMLDVVYVRKQKNFWLIRMLINWLNKLIEPNTLFVRPEKEFDEIVPNRSICSDTPAPVMEPRFREAN